ncbi:MAG: hypothetical protein UX86_C0009G0008 [Candidatus Amesbacteria bacterium GW2011_GWC1_47_15]|uniref:Uncharacterized protein n=1 Tax=Candidatus Amesbacteria bacterium GW2011_GWC1_47_15 TaxID=1618364 RepID=A0A0G1UE23_9BACT|nr:MAG: hypothetical protein UX86_C0009G0008 [Candidatus Amesbacteria bacterium GW2011_GWC1_47_15]
MPVLIIIAAVLVAVGVVARSTFLPPDFPVSVPAPTATLPPTPSPTPVPVPSKSTPVAPASDWRYPGSTQTSTGVYVSSDVPEKITDWYRQKFNSLGLNVRSIVNTRANEKILNKLSGSGSGMEIEIEIGRNPGAGQVTIKVDIDN